MKTMTPEGNAIRRVFRRVKSGAGHLPTASGNPMQGGSPANRQLVAVGLRKVGVPPIRFKKFRRKKASSS